MNKTEEELFTKKPDEILTYILKEKNFEIIKNCEDIEKKEEIKKLTLDLIKDKKKRLENLKNEYDRANKILENIEKTKPKKINNIPLNNNDDILLDSIIDQKIKKLKELSNKKDALDETISYLMELKKNRNTEIQKKENEKAKNSNK